ncbi:unnamed protein product [Closterium sp. NIES-53]
MSFAKHRRSYKVEIQVEAAEMGGCQECREGARYSYHHGMAGKAIAIDIVITIIAIIAIISIIAIPSPSVLTSPGYRRCHCHRHRIAIAIASPSSPPFQRRCKLATAPTSGGGSGF